MEAKRYPDAIIYYEKAIRIQPHQRDFFDLGRVYALSGHNDKAFEALNQAVTMGMNAKKEYEGDISLASLKEDNRWQDLATKLK